MAVVVEEHLDVLTKTGEKTGTSKPRGHVHRDGDYHRAVHVWIFSESTRELLLQRRADCKDSWPGLWDISSAGHISAGDSSLVTARRELDEELGVILPKDAFEFLFVFLQEWFVVGLYFCLFLVFWHLSAAVTTNELSMQIINVQLKGSDRSSIS
ncbi:Nudix hydrolase [Thalictrum thalictroides]|uniref:Nudix hydrolase n=1 Tax=Thalictrum thalictroides TaxID=46969 RepID=A0A7J6VLP6_THATH|nr:Nudix hydrolase [Thalictrum thalictroides]